MKVVYKNEDFWKNYMINWFGDELIDKWYKNIEITQIYSKNGKINLEVYKTPDLYKPTLVFSHGIAGYARILLPFTIPLFEKGFNIIATDLEGYGYNERIKGDFTWDTHLENLKDTVGYARSIFKGKIYLGGASMGGPLAYATDVRYDCADGLICWCLWDLSDKEFVEKETNTKKLTYPLIPLMKILAKLLGKMRLKTYRLISYDTLTANQEFNDLLKTDPQAGTLISLRGACSLITQSKPDIKYEEYKKPVLVCQPKDDRMTPGYYTKKVFEKLKTKSKRYIEFTGEHFPLEKEIYVKWGNEVEKFINENE